MLKGLPPPTGLSRNRFYLLSPHEISPAAKTPYLQGFLSIEQRNEEESRSNQPSLEIPCFVEMNCFHKPWDSSPILHSHLPRRARFISFIDLKPNPPSSLGLQTWDHFIRWEIFFWLPCQRKSCSNFSIHLNHLHQALKHGHEVNW